MLIYAQFNSLYFVCCLSFSKCLCRPRVDSGNRCYRRTNRLANEAFQRFLISCLPQCFCPAVARFSPRFSSAVICGRQNLILLCSKWHQKRSHIQAAHSSPLRIERDVFFFWPSENKRSEHWFQKPISKAPGECLAAPFVWTWVTLVLQLHRGCARSHWRDWSRFVAQH